MGNISLIVSIVAFCSNDIEKNEKFDEKVKVEIYRDNARGGEFSLRHTLFLN
jgi:hypothetical protein